MTPFDFAFLTERRGVTFTVNPNARKAIAGIVDDAHQNGLRIGATLQLQRPGIARAASLDDDQTLISDTEGTLDSNGSGTFQTTAMLRSGPPRKMEVLRVVAFRKTSDGEYDPATLTDVTDCIHNVVIAPGKLSFSVLLGPQFKGLTVFAMTTAWFSTLDLTSDAFTNWTDDLIGQYRGIPLDGTSLDEFGYAGLPHGPNEVFRSHFAGRSFSTRFKESTKRSLPQTIFETRFASAGHPEVRIAAIDQFSEFFGPFLSRLNRGSTTTRDRSSARRLSRGSTIPFTTT